jgi:hypothetical protein
MSDTESPCACCPRPWGSELAVGAARVRLCNPCASDVLEDRGAKGGWRAGRYRQLSERVQKGAK